MGLSAVVEIAELRALPQRVVDVLHRQVAQLRGLSRAPAGVGHAQIAHQRRDRPAVGGDVVHHGHQHVFVFADTEKRCPQGNFGGQVEGVARRGVDGLVQPRRRPGASASMTCQPNSARSSGHHHLLRDPVGRHKQCAQALVAGHHVGQRGTQRVGIKAAVQPQRHRHVVDRRGTLQLVQEPQPVLGERQRHHRRAAHRHQRLQPARTRTDARRQLRRPWAPRTRCAPRGRHRGRC